MVEIKAAARLVAFKEPDLEFLDKNHDKVLNALESLKKWYKDNSGHKAVESYVPLLMKAFDYDPYTKPVFRALPIPKDIAQPKEGKTYTINTALKAVQSWTTSAKIAEEFIDKQDYKTSDYGIFELKDTGHQLCNYKWIRQVAKSLLEKTKGVDDLYEIFMDTKGLMAFLDEFEHEQEVILRLPSPSKVKLVKILGG